MNNIHNTREMHEEIVFINKRNWLTKSGGGIKSTKGRIIIEKSEIAQRWRNIRDLFENNRGEIIQSKKTSIAHH